MGLILTIMVHFIRRMISSLVAHVTPMTSSCVSEGSPWTTWTPRGLVPGGSLHGTANLQESMPPPPSKTSVARLHSCCPHQTVPT